MSATGNGSRPGQSTSSPQPSPRPPLRPEVLDRLLAGVPGPRGAPWRVTTVASTGSTNADVVSAAADGAGEGEVRAAELQTAGRGRLGRVWTAPVGASLTFSVLLRPPVPLATWAWLPLLAGVALAEGVRATTGVDVRLKWPNDLLVATPDGEAKLAGVLVERAGDAAVVGVGLNVTQTADELPVPTATSLRLAGAPDADRERVLVGVLGALTGWYDRWCDAAGDAGAGGLRAAYVGGCATLGRQVRVTLPHGGDLRGAAVDVDGEGRLVVRDGDRVRTLAAGDVRHVR